MNKFVYVAGPYTAGDPLENTKRAIAVSNTLLEAGYVPFCPHLSHYWHLLHPQEYDVWIDYDMEWLLKCDCVLRLDGESAGADGEVNEAEIQDMQVYYGDAGLTQLLQEAVSAMLDRWDAARKKES